MDIKFIRNLLGPKSRVRVCQNLKDKPLYELFYQTYYELFKIL